MKCLGAYEIKKTLSKGIFEVTCSDGSTTRAAGARLKPCNAADKPDSLCNVSVKYTVKNNRLF